MQHKDHAACGSDAFECVLAQDRMTSVTVLRRYGRMLLDRAGMMCSCFDRAQMFNETAQSIGCYPVSATTRYVYPPASGAELRLRSFFAELQLPRCMSGFKKVVAGSIRGGGTRCYIRPPVNRIHALSLRNSDCVCAILPRPLLPPRVHPQGPAWKQAAGCTDIHVLRRILWRA